MTGEWFGIWEKFWLMQIIMYFLKGIFELKFVYSLGSTLIWFKQGFLVKYLQMKGQLFWIYKTYQRGFKKLELDLIKMGQGKDS